MSEWVDGDYPTDAALERIRDWPVDQVNDGLDFIASIWHWPDFGVSRKLKPAEIAMLEPEANDRFLRLATGGWSGNESIVGAVDDSLIGMVCWRLSQSGGLRIYRYIDWPSKVQP